MLIILSYINAVSEVATIEPPRQLRGDIISDLIGLGKTLTMIALVATDQPVRSLEDLPFQEDDAGEHTRHVPTTLIIVPPSREYQLDGPSRSDVLTFDQS